MSDNNYNNGSFLAGIMFGMLVGGALGVLLAPQSGKEIRKTLIRKGKEIGKKLQESYVEVKADTIDLKEKAGKAYKAAERELKK